MINYYLVSAVGKAILQEFTSIRATTVAHYKFTTLASALAAVFVIFKLIQIVNDIQGDNEAGGFGHVKLWDMIRPIVFYMLVLVTPNVIKAVDYSVNTVTTAIDSRSKTKTDLESVKSIADTWVKFWDKTNEIANRESQYKWYEFVGRQKDAWTKFCDFVVAFFTACVETGFELVVGIINLIFNLVSDIYIGICQINLTIIQIFAPFVFALSILDPWKKNYQKVIANYVYYSLWPPILNIILYLINNGIGIVQAVAKNNDFSNSIVGLISKTGLIQADDLALNVVKIIILLVGIASLFSVPAMANAALNMGSNHDIDSAKAAGKAAGTVPGLNKIL